MSKEEKLEYFKFTDEGEEMVIKSKENSVVLALKDPDNNEEKNWILIGCRNPSFSYSNDLHINNQFWIFTNQKEAEYLIKRLERAIKYFRDGTLISSLI